MNAILQISDNRKQLLEDCRIMQDALTDTTAIDEEIDNPVMEIEIVNGIIRNSIKENAEKALNQNGYMAKYKNYDERYNKLNSRINHLNNLKNKRHLQYTAIGAFMFEVMELPKPPTVFDNKLWIASIDHATVYKDGTIVFKFVNGVEVEA
ncbi:MAG: hypothetical protein IJT23_08430 [Clostridia bacterium]|nr:hypothetical protein [Clostridia bacterium]